MEELKEYIESVLINIEGVNQFNYLIDESELDGIQERKSGFVGLSFSNVVNNSQGNEVITTSFIFENYLDQERFTFLYQMDVLKKIIGEFKRTVLLSKKYEFPNEWNLETFTNRSVNATCGYFINMNVIILGSNNCTVAK